MAKKENLPSPEFPRHDPVSGRIFAERVLFEEMERAAELLQSEQDFGRAGIRCALEACHGFLHVRGLSGQGLKPLKDLIAAMRVVEKGTLPEFFDPKLIAGAVPDRKWSRSPAATETKQYAAACMEALTKDRLSKDRAAAKVAEHAQKWPRVSEGIIEKVTVINWRDELRQQQASNSERVMFEGLAKMFSDGPNAKAYLEEALRTGPRMTGGVRKPKT